MISNKELLFNLIKKLDSGEIKFLFVDKRINKNGKMECFLKASGVKIAKIGEIEEVGFDKILFSSKHEEDWNKEFKEEYKKEQNESN